MEGSRCLLDALLEGHADGTERFIAEDCCHLLADVGGTLCDVLGDPGQERIELILLLSVHGLTELDQARVAQEGVDRQQEFQPDAVGLEHLDGTTSERQDLVEIEGLCFSRLLGAPEELLELHEELLPRSWFIRSCHDILLLVSSPQECGNETKRYTNSTLWSR